jgi:hypothetical protein
VTNLGGSHLVLIKGESGTTWGLLLDGMVPAPKRLKPGVWTLGCDTSMLLHGERVYRWASGGDGVATMDTPY